MDQMTVGARLRYFRNHRSLTLQALSERCGVAPTQLSTLENGLREIRLSQLERIAEALGVALEDLLLPEPPDERSALELELARAQSAAVFRDSGLPAVRRIRAVPTDALRALVHLHREMDQRAVRAQATPEEARRANTDLRLRMRSEDNYLQSLETVAEELLRVIGHEQGALTHHNVSRLAEHLGFVIIHVNDLPHSTRSVTDLKHGRLYLPPASIPGGHGLRALALQAMAHRVLGHQEPVDYAGFLQQRLEINYFAAACLMPERASVQYLADARSRRDIAIEDFRDAFGVTHEAAALRLTNLATRHLGLQVHFLRVGDDGAVYKAYENDGLPLPTDASGSVEGQLVHPAWAARAAFERTNRTTEYYQLTDTLSGTFWCSTQTGTSALDEFSISVGVRFADSKWFRGRETKVRRNAADRSWPRTEQDLELESRWRGRAWPSARVHAHVFSPLPSGTFPGVDDAELYQFLEAHADQ